MLTNIDILTKTGTHVHTIITHTRTLPRVGEYITTPAHLLPKVGNLPQLLVTDVIYYVTDSDELAATVVCFARGDEPMHRTLLLEEQGWIHARE